MASITKPLLQVFSFGKIYKGGTQLFIEWAEKTGFSQSESFKTFQVASVCMSNDDQSLFSCSEVCSGVGRKPQAAQAGLTEEPVSEVVQARHPDAQGLEGCWAGAQPHSNSLGHSNGVPAPWYPMPGHGGVRLWPDLQQLSGTLKPSL